jgi:hypothetical protein
MNGAGDAAETPDGVIENGRRIERGHAIQSGYFAGDSEAAAGLGGAGLAST